MWRRCDDGAPRYYDVGASNGGSVIMEVECLKHDDDCGYAYGPRQCYDS